MFRFYVLGHFHVALSLVSMYYLAGRIWGLRFDGHWALWLFFAGLGGYNLMRLAALESHRDFIRDFYERHLYAILLITLVSLIMAGYLFFGMPAEVKRWLIFPAVLSLFYNLRPGRKLLAWREIAYIKILLVAVVWGLLAAYIPFRLYHHSGAPEAGIWVSLWTLLLILPFDVRDLALDAESLHTLPQVFRGKISLLSLLLGILYLWPVWVRAEQSLCLLIPVLAGGLLSVGAVWAAPRMRRSFYFSAFWVEGIPLAVALLSLFCR